MCEAIQQMARPAITGSAVFADARHESRPVGLAVSEGHTSINIPAVARTAHGDRVLLHF